MTFVDNFDLLYFYVFFFQAEDGIRDVAVTGVQTCALPICEDVKEYYFYADSTPTHSYMKYLYKYPQAEFPYARLIEENLTAGKSGGEFELQIGRASCRERV